MDYNTLVADRKTAGSIKFLVNYDRFDPADIINMATEEIYRELRVARMRKTDDGLSLAAGANTYAPASDLIAPIAVFLSTIGELDHVRPDLFLAEHVLDPVNGIAEGPATSFAFINNVITFDYKADKAYGGKLLYWSRFTDLSPANPTNELTTTYQRLFHCFLVAYASEAKKDYDERDRYLAEAQLQIERANAEADLFLSGYKAG